MHAPMPQPLSTPRLNRCHLFCVLLTHGNKRTEPRAKPHQNGEYAGTWFPHAPTDDTH
jgi:hypothetical protein